MQISEYRNGGALIIARHGEQLATKLTEAQAKEILARIELRKELQAQAAKLSNPQLADKFGLNHKSVSRILNSQRGTKPYSHMSVDDYALIRQCAAERDRLKSKAALHSDKVLAAEYGVSASLICQIGMGTRWVRLPLVMGKGNGNQG